MKKRIFWANTFLVSIGILLASIAVSIIFYFQLTASARVELENRANSLKQLSTYEYEPMLLKIVPRDLRLTIIAPDGSVNYDNYADPSTMANHSDREEVIQALEQGYGQSRRVSETLRTDRFYHAIRLDDGNVLRVSKSVTSIYAVFQKSLPPTIFMIMVMAVLCYVGGAKLADRIVEPINNADIENFDGMYDELSPFIRALLKQREQISKDMETIKNRQDTIEAILDNMSEGAVIVDKDEKILHINKSAGFLFGLSDSSHLAEKTVHSLFWDWELLEITKQALSGVQQSKEKSFNGKVFKIFANPVPALGAAILLFMDTTGITGAKIPL
ncbi:MAG: PAS domain-containing protein [Eubacteriaceae bacterium]|nr:PAS domain-containing protein [Eubacteriaceae bacterium]